MATTSLTDGPDAVTRAAAGVPEAFDRGADGHAVRQTAWSWTTPPARMGHGMDGWQARISLDGR